MLKLRIMSASQARKILEQHGFKAVRQSGSHIVMRRILPDRGITVPVTSHSDIARGTLKSIISQSEIPQSEFMG